MKELSNYYWPKKSGAVNTEELTASLIEHGYHSLHTARAKGYIPSKGACVNVYSGKFGEGYVLHTPNNESAKRSNRYHDIIYFVK